MYIIALSLLVAISSFVGNSIGKLSTCNNLVKHSKFALMAKLFSADSTKCGLNFKNEVLITLTKDDDSWVYNVDKNREEN
jgi:hypothetical protein